MATSVQTLPLTRNPNKSFHDPFPTPPLSSRCSMGSVGSLVEHPDGTPGRASSRAVPQVGPRQTNGLLKKGFTQRELLNYLNITRKEPKAGAGGACRKDILSVMASVKREQVPEEGNIYTKVYHKDADLELGANSLPTGGKYEKPRLRPSAFKPVTPKNFSSMQNLYPSSHADEPDLGLSNGLHRAYGHTPRAVSTSSSSSSPSRHGGPTSTGHKVLSSVRGLSQEEENLSDSGHNSINSLPPYQPPYRPPYRPHLSHISASMGHINTIGSLDRSSLGSKAAGAAAPGEVAMSCRSMATLSRLALYGGEAPPPYEMTLSQSVEEVVRDLEERLVEKEHELRQVRRNLDESEGAIAQVFEGKQRLWEKEVEELRLLYAAKLRQVTQHAQRSQRSLQLQLYKAQQEKNRLLEELEGLRRESSREGAPTRGQGTSPTLEETQWEVCQKSGEISLLKQQVRDSQAEVTHKLSEIFQLKTQLRETRGELRGRDSQIAALQLALQGASRRHCPSQEDGEGSSGGATVGGAVGGSTEERLRAELLLERRQSEAQATAFEEERRTWQEEKEKVIRYQRELQASYLEMHQRHQNLEAQMLGLRPGRGREGGGVAERRGTLERELQEVRAGREREGGGGREGGERRGTLEREQQEVRAGRERAGGEGGERSGTLERDVQEPRAPRRGRGGTEEEDKHPAGLPWIERIESSEI